MFFPLITWSGQQLGWARPGGEGGHQGEKNFFAFLDVSDHLEAKKINK